MSSSVNTSEKHGFLQELVRNIFIPVNVKATILYQIHLSLRVWIDVYVCTLKFLEVAVQMMFFLFCFIFSMFHTPSEE